MEGNEGIIISSYWVVLLRGVGGVGVVFELDGEVCSKLMRIHRTLLPTPFPTPLQTPLLTPRCFFVLMFL